MELHVSGGNIGVILLCGLNYFSSVELLIQNVVYGVGWGGGGNESRNTCISSQGVQSIV